MFGWRCFVKKLTFTCAIYSLLARGMNTDLISAECLDGLRAELADIAEINHRPIVLRRNIEELERKWANKFDSNPDFSKGLHTREKSISNFSERYAKIIQSFANDGLNATNIRDLIAIERDAKFRKRLDEFESYQNSLRTIQGTRHDSLLQLTQSYAQKMMGLQSNRDIAREKIRNSDDPAVVQQLLREWPDKDLVDHHPDTPLDWALGSDGNLGASNLRIDPETGQKIAYAGTPSFIIQDTLAHLPFKPGDRVLEVGSGLGKILLTGAVARPDVKFRGVEFVQERADHVSAQIERLKLKNAENKQGDATLPAIETDIAESQVIFLYNPLGPPAWAAFQKRLQKVLATTHEKKYIVTIRGTSLPQTIAEDVAKIPGMKLYYSNQQGHYQHTQYQIFEFNP
jgi:hypothetical protein